MVQAGKKAAVLVLSVFLLAGFAVQTGMDVQAEETAAEEMTGADQAEERRQLQITVVEDIPAMDIEESPVPLAALPNTRAKSGMRHALWMGGLLIAVIVYAAYFSVYDRRLYGLRREAAGMEKKLMNLRRTGIPEEKHER